MEERTAGAPGALAAPEAAAAPSDQSLLRHFCDGSGEAATQLYRRYARRLRALVRSRCSPLLAPRLDVDDVVQSVFRSFFRAANAGAYEVPDGKGLWRLLLTITLNKVRSQGAFHRAARRDVRLTTSLQSEVSSADGPAWEDDSPDTFFQLVLEEALEGLPAQQRALVELRLHGHEVADIARHVGRSKRTVERGLQQALLRLSALLQGEG